MSVTMHALPADQRPRERLLRLGAPALTDAELVAVLLGGGRVGASAVDVAHELLQARGGPSGLAGSRPEELARQRGVGPAKAARLLAGAELARRVDTAPGPAVVRASADLASVVAPFLAHERAERLVVVVLDGGHRVRHVEVVAQGAVDRTPLPVREVLSLVLRHDGRAFAVAHNHPGGSAEPSTADHRGTVLLRVAAGQVGLRLVDHLVVAGPRWTSVSEAG